MYKKTFKIAKKLHEYILSHYISMGILYLIVYAVFVYYYPITSQTINNMYLIPLPILNAPYLTFYILINVLHIKLYSKLIDLFKSNGDIGALLNIAFTANYIGSVYILIRTYIQVI